VPGEHVVPVDQALRQEVEAVRDVDVVDDAAVVVVPLISPGNVQGDDEMNFAEG